MVITANKISNETKTISKEVGTRDISTGLQKLQDFYDLAVADESIVKDFVRDNFFKAKTVSNLQKLHNQEKERKLQTFKSDFDLDVKDFFEKLESDLAATQKMIVFLKSSSALKLLKDAEIVDFKSNFGYTRYRLKNPVLNIDWNDQYNVFARLAEEFGKDLADDIVDISSKISENVTLNNIGRWKTPNKQEELGYFSEAICSYISELLKTVISKESSVARKVYLNLSKNKLILIQERHNVLGKDDVNDVEKIIEKITSSWSAKNVLYNLNNIISAVSSERVYKQKVYFSLLKNKLVFSKTNCEDLLLIVEFKTTTAGFDLFKECVGKDDMTEFYDYVVKRIISGLKRQTSRTISYTEYPLSSAVKGYVPICLYTDEEILSRISHFNINDIKSIIKNTSDPDQVKRLIKLWQDSMI